MEIKLPREAEQRLTASIQRYLREELGEDVGELKSTLFLRFCMEEIAPTIYNHAIQDARAFMQEKVDDLENVCFVKEASHGKAGSRRPLPRKPQ